MNAVIDGGSPETMISVAVAVNGSIGGQGGEGSRRAVRWAVENLLPRADRVILLYVMPTIISIPTPSGFRMPIRELDANVVNMYVNDTKFKFEKVFVPFKKLCKSCKVETLVLEGDNPAIALLTYISESGIKSLVLGSSSSNWIQRRLKGPGVSSSILKYAPESCNIYVVARQRLITKLAMPSPIQATSETNSSHWTFSQRETVTYQELSQSNQTSFSNESYEEVGSSSISEISYPNSEGYTYRRSNTSSNQERDEQNLGLNSLTVKRRNSSTSTINMKPNVQDEIEELRLELQDTVALYRNACEELVVTQNKVRTLSSECLNDAKKVKTSLERARTVNKNVAEEKIKYLEAIKDAELAKELLAKETYERKIAERKALNESLERQKFADTVFSSDCRYRKYSKDEIEGATDFLSESKVIGVGGYGKVYRGNLDHTPVAIKVLHVDAPQRKEEFLKEVEVLTCLRHPHMVSLLGACPESYCLVYEYMANGSLEQHIFTLNNRPPLSWHIRFRIAFEIACGLTFLHNSKPEPIVHRDLKPANILLDKNFVSKIGDVGLAKYIFDDVPDDITQYRESTLAGTFFYIDPEYYRTGTLRPKSDLYAFGVIMLQLLTARKPKGLVHTIENAIDNGLLVDKLDKSVIDWPLAETEELVQLALKCCNLRCRDRPDLDTEVLPLLKRLVDIADESLKLKRNNILAPRHYYCPILEEVMKDPYIAADGFTYEHRAMQTWLEKHDVSPVTKLRLKHTMLTPNHTLRYAIQEWMANLSLTPV